jgi:hypothetical protein
MRRILTALLASGLLCLSAGQAHAQQGPQIISPCIDYAGNAALPSLQQAYQFDPSNMYGPSGWAQYMGQPFGAGPYGPATAFSPPGLVAAYGPFGPGPTAANIAALTIPPGGFGFNNPNINNFANTTTALGLAGLQQGELGTLYGRYGLGAGYQTAAGMWTAGLSGRAASTFAILLALCINHNPPQLPGMTPPASQDGSGS